jgi:hypothetical protein
MRRQHLDQRLHRRRFLRRLACLDVLDLASGIAKQSQVM